MKRSLTDVAVWRQAALIVPVAFVAAFLVHIFVLQGFGNSGDEYAYLWQATAFSEGRVTAPVPQPAAAFKQNALGDSGGIRYSKYPPGWPLLLAAGATVGLPGVINPLLAALALAGMYVLACSWAGPRAAIFGVLAIGTSPFFLLNAGSYHSHPSCLFALTALALTLAWARERPGALPLFLAGASFGLAVLIRPYTAVLIGLPLIIGLGWPLLRNATLIWFCAGGLPAVAFLMIVNKAATGSWWTLAWTRFDASETLGFVSYGHTLFRGLKTTVRLGLEGVAYTSFIALPLLFASRDQRITHVRLLWITLAAPVAGYVFWWSDGGNRYGPRFYFEALLPLTILVGAGLERLARGRWARPAFAAAALATLASLGVLGARAYQQVKLRRDIYRVADEAGLQNAIVLLKTASSDMVRLDLNRNPPDFQHAPVMYGMSRGGLDYEVATAYPDRRLYYYEWRPEGGRIWPVPAEELQRQ
jgi:hypothetical protein